MPPTVLSRPSPHLQILIVHGKGNAVGGQRRPVDGHPIELIGDTGRIAGHAEDQADLSFKTHSRPKKIVMLPAPAHMADQRNLPFQPRSSPYCPVGDTEIGCGSHEGDRLLLANECESYHSVPGCSQTQRWQQEMFPKLRIGRLATLLVLSGPLH